VGVLSQSLRTNSYVHRMSKKERKQCQEHQPSVSPLLRFLLRTRQTGLCLGLSPLSNILYHPVPFRCLISKCNNQHPGSHRHAHRGDRRCSPSFIVSVLDWLTALRLLPHEIYPRSTQRHFACTPGHDVVMRSATLVLTIPALAPNFGRCET
jgi:hypothetical protein